MAEGVVLCDRMLLSALGLQSHSQSWERAQCCFVAGLDKGLDVASFPWFNGTLLRHIVMMLFVLGTSYNAL